MMRLSALFATLLIASTASVAAHHPGDRLDEVMAEKEPAFEPRDLRHLPPLALTEAEGELLPVSWTRR